MYKNNHVLGGVAWEVAQLCVSSGEILVVEQQARRVVQGKVNSIREGLNRKPHPIFP